MTPKPELALEFQIMPSESWKKIIKNQENFLRTVAGITTFVEICTSFFSKYLMPPGIFDPQSILANSWETRQK